MREWKKHYGAMHFGIGHGADRGKVNSILQPGRNHGLHHDNHRRHGGVRKGQFKI